MGLGKNHPPTTNPTFVRCLKKCWSTPPGEPWNSSVEMQPLFFRMDIVYTPEVYITYIASPRKMVVAKTILSYWVKRYLFRGKLAVKLREGNSEFLSHQPATPRSWYTCRLHPQVTRRFGEVCNTWINRWDVPRPLKGALKEIRETKGVQFGPVGCPRNLVNG